MSCSLQRKRIASTRSTLLANASLLCERRTCPPEPKPNLPVERGSTETKLASAETCTWGDMFSNAGGYYYAELRPRTRKQPIPAWPRKHGEVGQNYNVKNLSTYLGLPHADTSWYTAQATTPRRRFVTPCRHFQKQNIPPLPTSCPAFGRDQTP